MNLSYRTAQFVRNLGAKTKLQDLARAWPFLTDSQRILFLRLPAADQLHSLKVLDLLVESGETDSDLLAAALLHDVGKTRYSLGLWERVFVVLAHVLAPAWAASAADEQRSGFRRALAIGKCHAEWGADMIRDTGASLRLVDLIRRHQDPPAEPTNETERLLLRLQQVDNVS
jgi:putative nucleotidyltransferase with HDIG domain